MTPRGGWFRSSRHMTTDEGSFRGGVPSSMVKTSTILRRPPKKKVIMGQSMVIDIDPNKVRVLGMSRCPVRRS